MRPLQAFCTWTLAVSLAPQALAGIIPTFTDIGAGLTGVSGAATAWGDYDGDGDLDLAVTGRTFVNTKIARIYKNTGGNFTDSGLLPASAETSDGYLAFGDYDNDGDLDLAVAGTNSSVTRVTIILRNDVSAFNDISATLVGVDDGQLVWADYDNDGDLDLMVAGTEGVSGSAEIYRNDAGVFSPGIGFSGYRDAAIAFGDYDNDGDLDLIRSGIFGVTPQTNLTFNFSGLFFASGQLLPSTHRGDFDWGDYDGDGDLDLLMAGSTGSAPMTEIFENQGGTFVDIDAGLQGSEFCTAKWGDIDNDGDLDFVVGGSSASVGFTNIYQQTDVGFFDINANLPDEFPVSAAWGDYDNDGDLDLAYHAFGFSRIYRNDGVPANTPPTAPSGLLTISDATHVMFSWSTATDAETGSSGLSYNLRVGTTPGGSEIVAPMSDPVTGFRHVPEIGNAGQVLQWPIEKSAVGSGPIYWSVQAIDGAFAGSPWATEQAGILSVADSPDSDRLSLRLRGPNPFRAQARLAYRLPHATTVDLAIYDVAGSLIVELASGRHEAGQHVVRWTGGGTAPGLYFARLRAGAQVTTLKLLKLE